MPRVSLRSGLDALVRMARVRGTPWIIAGVVAAGLGTIMLLRAVAPDAAPVVGSARGAAVPGRAPGGACVAAEAFYRHTAPDAALLSASTAPYFEIALDGRVFGPGPGAPVPWTAVAAWAAAHPESALEGCAPSEGWLFAALRVEGGYAYVQMDPSGALTKLYLSPVPLPWD